MLTLWRLNLETKDGSFMSVSDGLVQNWLLVHCVDYGFVRTMKVAHMAFSESVISGKPSAVNPTAW